MLYVWFGVLLCWLYNKLPIKDSNDTLNLEPWFNGSYFEYLYNYGLSQKSHFVLCFILLEESQETKET